MSTYRFSPQAFDPLNLPDFWDDFIEQNDIDEFSKALCAPESVPFVSLNDWKPIHQRVRRRRSSSRKNKRKVVRRTRDETREGFVYTLFKWPLLLVVLGWIVSLGVFYWITRFYVWVYERFITWRGRRQDLRTNIRSRTKYEDWKGAAQELDRHLGNEKWKGIDDYAYYDSVMILRAKEELEIQRTTALLQQHGDPEVLTEATQKLKALVETCVKYNYAGTENPRVYSETYYGTKTLVQDFVDELYASIDHLLQDSSLNEADKYSLCTHLSTNFGRTALCLSGGASFAYYHFGVAKALLDATLLPSVITGTSGGALVAALLATRTDEELRLLLVPALSHRIKANSLRRATLISQCFIRSAVLASAAVPGILNPIPMMMKKPDGTIGPYSFGHKWKDGSLRTDIPLKALNLHFGVTFPIVSQVNPHINAFFYASKGTVGRPVTHRKGRGWRGGYLGSALETYLKLELQKFLKILRHLELLPRPLGQDWSSVWLQQFSGTITIWPKSHPSDFWYILSDPDSSRLARMIRAGEQSTWPKILFIENRMKIERLISKGLSNTSKGRHDNTDLSTPRQQRTSSNESAFRHSIETSDTLGGLTQTRDRRSSTFEEIKRQSGIFFDDLVEGEEDTGESEIEEAFVEDGENGPKNDSDGI
ncbi:uncharacterized protein KY384_008325 [Bacidia gigantensis]|uniref:uncharacterized protein n=1 Tax=Bacidia gigantensis TaxID=2732470 RepID=UPI001D0526B9|nr:uncharacterized protein KY384_008325 [Bacidia gigantensis]KAG8526896.1 hypothetical protein KY384_008325 [Bacidia gigantensis]